MPTIREVKTELRHREWAEQIQECQSSGMTVTAWCKEKGISQHTYYSRLNVVRKELLKPAANAGDHIGDSCRSIHPAMLLPAKTIRHGFQIPQNRPYDIRFFQTAHLLPLY